MPVRRRAPLSGKALRDAAEKHARASELDVRSQKAWRAVRAFTKMLPQLTSFARMATGNNRIAVRLAERNGAETDGTVIYMHPPIELGTERIHDRNLCDRRGPNKRLLCKACDARDAILMDLFHEIAHIAFKSTTRPLVYVQDKILNLLEEWHPRGCAHHDYKVLQLDVAGDYLQACAVQSEYLPIILNCLEDARVNARMFKARPGLRVMFEAGTWRIFNEGIKLKDGRVVMWRDQPRDAQAMIGLFLLASGVEIEPGYLSEEVAELLNDPVLGKICKQIINKPSVHQVTEASLDAFRRLNELGYCSVNKCTPEPPMPSPPAGPDDEEKDANQGSEGGSSQGGDNAGDEGQEAGDGQPGDDGGAAGQGGSPNDGSAGHQQDAGGSSPAGTPQSGDDTPSTEGSEGSSGGEGGGTDSSGENAGRSGDPSSDGVPQGADDDNQASRGEGQSAPATGAGAGDDDDRDDSDDLEGSKSASSSGEDEAGSDSNQVGDADSKGEPGQGGEESDRPSQGSGEGDNGASENADGGLEDDQDGDPSEPATRGRGDIGDDPDDDDDFGYHEHREGRRPVDESVWDEQFDKQEERPVTNSGSSPAPWTPADIAELVRQFGGHREVSDDDVDDSGIHRHLDGELHSHESEIERHHREVQERAAVALAAQQSASFDTQSIFMSGLDVVQFPNPRYHWQQDGYVDQSPDEFMPSERILGSALMRARRVFEDNKRAAHVRHLKSGKPDATVLARRAPFDDPRLFMKVRRPGRRDYFAVIGVDVSGSTALYSRNPRIKRAVFAQAELFHRLGISFAIYGMTGGYDPNLSYSDRATAQAEVAMLEVKAPLDPWSKTTKSKLAALHPSRENYDGHNLEFLRKVCDGRPETDKLILYYTDGEMPAANGIEELVVLQTELLNCKKKGYSLLGIGINTDSPRQYGMDTVQVDSDEDVHLVVEQLGRKLTER